VPSREEKTQWHQMPFNRRGASTRRSHPIPTISSKPTRRGDTGELERTLFSHFLEDRLNDGKQRCCVLEIDRVRQLDRVDSARTPSILSASHERTYPIRDGLTNSR
jgi:hypothetical protein